MRHNFKIGDRVLWTFKDSKDYMKEFTVIAPPDGTDSTEGQVWLSDGTWTEYGKHLVHVEKNKKLIKRTGSL